MRSNCFRAFFPVAWCLRAIALVLSLILAIGTTPAYGAPTAASPAATSTDIAEIEAAMGLNIPPSTALTVLSLSRLFGPQLPQDTQFFRADVANPALQSMAFYSNYDEGYCGHFSIPGEDGAAADFARVINTPNPFDFIEQHLTFGSNDENDNGEWIIFAPGLNTLHATQPGWEQETTTPQRLEHYTQVLQTAMSQLHLGTDMDQGEIAVPLSKQEKLFLESQRSELTAGGIMPAIEGDTAIIYPRQRDRLETLLSQYGLARPLFQAHVVQLLQANEFAQIPIVWMVYSRASSEFSGALRSYVEDYIARHNEQPFAEAHREVEDLLRQTLTVVTVGNATRDWIDGPAYVHYSARSDRPEGGTDPLTNQLGVHIDAPQGAGRDAVFLHVDGLFSGFDAHNFGASGAGSLKLIMDMNDIKTYRELWEKGQQESLKVPQYDQVAAQVVLTNGAKWVWDNNSAWNGVNLPSQEKAQQIIDDLYAEIS